MRNLSVSASRFPSPPISSGLSGPSTGYMALHRPDPRVTDRDTIRSLGSLFSEAEQPYVSACEGQSSLNWRSRCQNLSPAAALCHFDTKTETAASVTRTEPKFLFATELFESDFLRSEIYVVYLLIMVLCLRRLCA